MPIGTFIPLDPADYSPRFFARPLAFDCECPRCGRLLLIGKGRRDDQYYDRVTGVLRCPKNTKGQGCDLKSLIGIVAWPISAGHKVEGQHRPRDQKPNARQLAELRQQGRGVWSRQKLTQGSAVNTIEPPIDDSTEE